MESHHASDGYDARKPGRYHLDFDRRSWQDSEKLLSSTQGEWLVIRIQIIHSYTSPDPSRHSNDIASQYTVETSRQDSLVRLFCRSDHLYHSCQLVVQGVGFTLLAWLCLISSPVGFFYAWRAWKQDQQK